MIDRTVAAVVLATDVSQGLDHRSARRIRRRVETLCALGGHVVLVARGGVRALDGVLAARPDGPGALLLVVHDGAETYEVGPGGPHLLRRHVTRRPPRADEVSSVDGPSDGMRATMRRLAADGIGPGLVLVVTHGAQVPREHRRPVTGRAPQPPADERPPSPDGDRHPAPPARPDLPVPPPGWERLTVVSTADDPGEGPDWLVHLGGGDATLLALLDEQVHRRRAGRVPVVDEDPGWTVREVGRDPVRHRVTETLMLLAEGGIATRGAVEEEPSGSVPLVLAAGVYDGTGSGTHLLPAPPWTGIDVAPPPVEDVRVLDLRTGVLVREEVDPTGPPLRSARFASADLHGVVALRTEGGPERLRPGPVFRRPPQDRAAHGHVEDVEWVRARGSAGGIGAVARQRRRRDGRNVTLERLAAYVSDTRRQPSLARATARLRRAQEEGFDAMLVRQRRAWAERWETVGVDLPGDPDAELALRFALFHLWGHTTHAAELAVGARGISGPAYSGHVFWDADVHVLPAVVTVDPQTAAAMVRYRSARLAAAAARARSTGYDGARFPWESAATGEDVTPATAPMLGRTMPVRTGELEEHVTADVAWGALRWATWAGVGAGPEVVELVTETARYWASRCEVDPDGSAHLRRVIGPDEYHEGVDDNAFTNVMARWNLRAAARLRESAGSPDAETGRWRRLADSLVDGLDPATGVYEQFRGYDGLEPLLVRDVAPPPVAADVLLGRERVARTRLLKQADVLMLHRLVPEETAPGSLAPNLDRYEPYTAHGSSLSPGVTAGLLARAGRAEEGLDMLHTALRLDLDDLTGTTAAGLHLATLAGSWSALVQGFLGARVVAGTLELDPHLPERWDDLEVRFRCLGRHVSVRVTGRELAVHTSRPVTVRVAGGPARLVGRSAVVPLHPAPAGTRG